MITAHLLGGKISSSSPDAFSLFEKANFGEKINNKIEYSGFEALYLLQKGKLEVQSSGKQLKEEEVWKRVKKGDKKFDTKYSAFSTLRSKGYLVKTGLKFGAEFRVYDKNTKVGEDHARWLLFTARENEALRWNEFSAKSRVAHSTKKQLLIAIIDDEGKATFYEVSWQGI